MMILVTYDVETVSKKGRKRLRQVAKLCEDYGQRVQNSVFECVLMPSQYTELKIELTEIINKKEDSLRIYHLGKKWQNRVENIGKEDSYDPERDTFIL